MNCPRAWHIDANHRHYPTGEMEGKFGFNASFTRRIGNVKLKGTPKAVLNAVCDRIYLFRRAC